MEPPWSCERRDARTSSYSYWQVYDDPFGPIYKASGKILGFFMPALMKGEVEKFESITENGGSSPDWVEELLPIFTDNSLSRVLFFLFLSCAVFCCSLAVLALARVGIEKLRGPKPWKRRQPNRFCYLLQLVVIVFLFAALVWCEVMYGVALAQMDREQRGIDWETRDLIQAIEKYENQQSLTCPFEKSSMSKEGIIERFELLNKGILDRCGPNGGGGGYREDNFTDKIPPGMEITVQKILTTGRSILDKIEGQNVVDGRSQVRFPEAVQMKGWLEQILISTTELQKSIESAKAIPDLQKFPEWRIRKQREKILLDAQAKTLSGVMNFFDVAEKRIERAGIVANELTGWIKGIVTILRKGYLEQVHTKNYNLNYVFYQGTVGTVAAIGMLFLAVAFFANLYRLVLPEGYSELRKQERSMGTFFLVGLLFLAQGSVFLLWNLDNIEKPALILRGTCDSLFQDKDFAVNGSSFYSRIDGVYNWPETDFPTSFRGVMEKLSRRESSLFRWNLSQSDNEIFGFVKVWTDGLPVILEDLHAAEQYPFKMSTVKKIRSAMYGIINLEEHEYFSFWSKSYGIGEDVKELLSDLAYLDFPLTENDAFKAKSNRDCSGWNCNITPGYYNDYNHGYFPENRGMGNGGCSDAVINYQNDVRKIGAVFSQQMSNVTARYNEMFVDSEIKNFFGKAETTLCETLADPTSSLLIFYVINMILWTITTITVLKVSRGWDLGRETRIALVSSVETLSTPLIDSEKLEEAVQNPTFTI